MTFAARTAGFLATVSISVCAAPARAQTPPAAATLTLSEAIDRAIAANPSLQASRAAARSADADARATRAAFWPSFTAAEGWRRSTQPVAAFGAQLNAGVFTADDFDVRRLNDPGRFDAYVSYVGVGQMIFDGGRTRAAAAASAAGSRAASARVSADEAALAADVAAAYAAALSSTLRVAAATAALDSAREDAARAAARRDAGTATDADVLATAVRVSQAEQDLTRASADRVIQRASLNALIGAALADDFALTLPEAPASPPDLPALVAAAWANRADLREASERVAQAEAGLRAARAAWWPDISTGAGYEWTGVRFGARRSSWSVTAGAQWTFSAGGAEAARAAAARAAVDEARARRDALTRRIELDVITAVQEWTVTLGGVGASARSVDATREAHRIVGERYSAGVASIADVLAAAADAAAARARDIASRAGVISTWAALQRAQGKRP